MLSFSTKAQTLKKLSRHLKLAKILPQAVIKVGELSDVANLDIIRRVADGIGGCEKIIVRSSALSEDGCESSNAGVFLSLKDIVADDSDGILNAVRKVAESYPECNPENEILIQPQLENITLCGVAFSIDPNNGGNYYVINYDYSGNIDSVTGGYGDHLRTYYCFRGYEKFADGNMEKVIAAVSEIEILFATDKVDVEFAFNSDGELFVFQARPLVVRVDVADLETQTEALHQVEAFLQRSMVPMPYVKGKYAIYSVMADWNPAEMIGILPKPLALSLYKRLITDSIWAYQRDNYGYRNLRSIPLMTDFYGLPYIDVRASFNSFIPKMLPDELCEKLADYYLDRFRLAPENHDKVEFEIIFSCFTFDIYERIKILSDSGFTQAEIDEFTEALKKLTNGIINAQNGLWKTDISKIEKLEHHYEYIVNGDFDDVTKIYWMLENCARYGTLPFAGLARAGFVAVELLKSLVSVGIINETDYYDYMAELNTVGSQMTVDKQSLSQQKFIEKYGHLRPGTYDILSPRYDSMPEMYFTDASLILTENLTDKVFQHSTKKEPFKLSIRQYDTLSVKMKELGFVGDVLDLFTFIKEGIEGREYSKFVFTKTLSQIIELFKRITENCGISTEDAAFADIRTIDKLYQSVGLSPSDLFTQSIIEDKAKYSVAKNLKLPTVICRPSDIYAFHTLATLPNFITMESCTGDVVSSDFINRKIKGKVLLIESADPGYDWIFQNKIAGFITAWGGANSHMAIRAGELGIPAVIGVGEPAYAKYKDTKRLHIDCASKKVEILK